MMLDTFQATCYDEELWHKTIETAVTKDFSNIRSDIEGGSRREGLGIWDVVHLDNGCGDVSKHAKG